jgi:carbon-monoxide dehydrogenase large subunit
VIAAPAPSPLRREDGRLLAGRARFVDDLHLDRMVHGIFIRSPHAHAEIAGIDSSAALAAGALCVLTARDLPFNDKPWVVRYWHPSIRNGMPKFLTGDRVRYVGDPVAFLIARNRYEAEDLAPLVSVTYRQLPALATVEDALADGAVELRPDWPRNVAAAFTRERGNARAALAAAAHHVRRDFHFARQTPLPLETRGVVADYDAGRGLLTVWLSTQAHYNVRENLASTLDIPEYQIRVIAQDVGGGFGSKSRTYAEEIIVSHASRKLRRPVKWIEDRNENLQATTHSRDAHVELELGCDGEGRFTALDALLTFDIGAYVFTSGIVTAEIAAAHIANCYKIADLCVEVRCVGTNKTPMATYRGAGQPESCFPMECLIDVTAKETGHSSLGLRRLNIVTPADLPLAPGMPLVGGQVRFESGNFPAMLDAALAQTGFTEEVGLSAEGDRIAWGLACGIEASGFVNFETARVLVDRAGNVTVLSGMTTQGQGQPTIYAQVCAETLGVDLDRVTVQMGDTQLVPFGRGAFACRGAIFGANAVRGAALALRSKILAHAGTLVQCEPSRLIIEHGAIKRQDGQATGLALADIARASDPGGPLHGGEAALETSHIFKADDPITYGVSVHACAVRLDPTTGFFKLLDYCVVHDAGRSLNRMIVDGQIVGGVAEGIAGATLCELAYDAQAQLTTGSLADYLVATAPEIPRIRLVHMETPATTNPLGVRGIGEGGVIPVAAAIANALARAIDPNKSGHETALFRLPLRPDRVFSACQAAGLDREP